MAECGACIMGPLFFVVGLFLIYTGAQRHLLLQKIKNIPTSKVRSVAVGLAEIFGKAKCLETLSSPISKATCIYWRLKCEYYQSGKNGGWRDFYNSSTSKMFYLEDDTGKILIDPNSGEIDIPSDFTSQGHIDDKGFLGLKRKPLNQKVLDYLAANPDLLSRFRSHSHQDLKVTESYIAEGDPLYVLGSAEPKDGVSSSIAHENLIMKKGKIDQILYISDSGEKNVESKVGWSIWIMLGAGFLFSAIGLAITIWGV